MRLIGSARESAGRVTNFGVGALAGSGTTLSRTQPVVLTHQGGLFERRSMLTKRTPQSISVKVDASLQRAAPTGAISIGHLILIRAAVLYLGYGRE